MVLANCAELVFLHLEEAHWNGRRHRSPGDDRDDDDNHSDAHDDDDDDEDHGDAHSDDDVDLSKWISTE